MNLIILISILCSISYYIGYYIGMKKGASIAKKVYREYLNKIL